MKNTVRVIAIATLAACGLAAQAQLTAAQGSKTLVSASPSVTRSLTGSFTMLQAVPAKALLVGGLDSRTARVGSKVEARLTETVTLHNGTILPKGTHLVGTVNKITRAQSGGNG